MKVFRIIYGILPLIIIISCATKAPLLEREPGIPAEKPAEIKIKPDSLTILAAGDNLYHSVMIEAGEEGDYFEAYREVLSLTEKADIAMVNQETLLAGKDYGFSGYPLFNTPQKVGRALAEAGFSIVNHATNHVMDKGEKAVYATMDFWDSISGVELLGIHRSKEERSKPKLLYMNNITLGFLSYTYGTNGIKVPADKPFLVSLINTETMAEEINAIRPLCDFLVVSMHWGEEYQHEYSKNQAELAAFLAKHNVDLVIGHHPHVIQPIEYLDRSDGKKMLCFYSLGNFLSAQTQTPTLLGAMAYIKIERGKSTEISEAGAIPLVTHYEKDFKGFKVYPLYLYPRELEEKHRQNQEKKLLSLEYMAALAAKIFGDREIKQNPFMR